jgi:hypothetical protein
MSATVAVLAVVNTGLVVAVAIAEHFKRRLLQRRVL